LDVALPCRFLKKSGKNRGVHCRFGYFGKKKIKNKLHFFLLTNWLTKHQIGIDGGELPVFAVSGNN